MRYEAKGKGCKRHQRQARLLQGASIRRSPSHDHKVEVEIKNYLEKQISDSQLGQSLDDGIAEVNAPMPGTILDILVKPGQKINKNDTLLILNAMKMENVIKSPMKGKVKTISVSKGENVNKNQLLISFE